MTMTRPSLEQCFMDTARVFAGRSTCGRLKVGCVITNNDMTNIVSIGYNGSAKGRPNECESDEPGKCGHLHAEMNALVKADYSIPNKAMFITHSPCLLCAKYIVNAGVAVVYFGEVYRDASALDFLAESGIYCASIDIKGERTWYKKDPTKPPPPPVAEREKLPESSFVASEYVPKGAFVRKP